MAGVHQAVFCGIACSSSLENFSVFALSSGMSAVACHFVCVAAKFSLPVPEIYILTHCWQGLWNLFCADALLLASERKISSVSSKDSDLPDLPADPFGVSFVCQACCTLSPSAEVSFLQVLDVRAFLFFHEYAEIMACLIENFL